MAYRSHGRAQVNTTSPRAFARCDRCGFIYNHADLKFQFDFRGPQLQNLRILVCKPCTDNPQPQLKPIILTQDPMPVMNARPEDYYYANTGNLSIVEPLTYDAKTGIPTPVSNPITTQDGEGISTQMVGPPLGLDPDAVMPLQGSVAFNIIIPALSISTTGTNVVTVTCSATHNLSENDQVSIYGTAIWQIMGFYSVHVVSATVFSYEIVPFISAGEYITETTRIATCKIGLPTGFLRIPILQLEPIHTANTPYFWKNNQDQPIYFTNDGGEVLLWSFPQ